VQPAQTIAWIDGDQTRDDLIDALHAQLAIYEPLSTYQTGFDYWESEYGP